MNENKHVFALYAPEINLSPGDTLIVITAKTLIHRIRTILRLSAHDQCILFDRSHHASVTIEKSNHQNITVSIKSIELTRQWHPSITFFLPILKRDALAVAVYSLVEAGVSKIQLITTHKIERAWQDREIARLERIIIAAAEQSKNFAFPSIAKPISFDNALNQLQSMPSYCANRSGKPMHAWISTLPPAPEHCGLLVGPEGDFTAEEYAALKDIAVTPLALTPTVLRAESAAFYLAATFRSIYTT